MAQATYITVAELVEAYDRRILADLSSDSGIDRGELDSTNPILSNVIERASADVEAAALVGGRYTTTVLADLQTADDWTLKGLVADLALLHLHDRRGSAPSTSLQERFKRASDMLEKLGEGKVVFNNAGTIDAGTPEVLVISAGDRANLKMVSDEPIFPSRNVRTF
jgi:hypothetical protein